MRILVLLLLAVPARADVTVIAETLEFRSGPHCGVLHVIGGARLEVQKVEVGTLADREIVVLISCPEMSYQPARLARYVLTPKRPGGWPGGDVSGMVKDGVVPWHLVKQTPLWDSGFGHFVGRPAADYANKKLPFAYTTKDGVIDSVSVELPKHVRGRRPAAAWMGYPPRKGMPPLKRKGAWVWPADDAKRRLAKGLEGRLKDRRFTVRRR